MKNILAITALSVVILTGCASSGSTNSDALLDRNNIALYLDHQEVRVKQVLTSPDIVMTRYDDRIVLNIPSTLTYETGSAVLNPVGVQTAKEIAELLREYKRTDARITGYTDSTGTYNRNLKLSQDRAQSVADVLLAEGIKQTRFQTFGLSSHDPIASNATAAGRAENRRVEVTLFPRKFWKQETIGVNWK